MIQVPKDGRNYQCWHTEFGDCSTMWTPGFLNGGIYRISSLKGRVDQSDCAGIERYLDCHGTWIKLDNKKQILTREYFHSICQIIDARQLLSGPRIREKDYDEFLLQLHEECQHLLRTIKCKAQYYGIDIYKNL